MPTYGMDDSKYYFNNIVPLGEEKAHTPFPGCKCKPTKKMYKGEEWLFHYSFDGREVWLAVEKELGMTCYEHGEFVSALYERGKPHGHFPRPELVFEYPHNKIDPR